MNLCLEIYQGIHLICRIIRLLFSSMRSYCRGSCLGPISSCFAFLLGLFSLIVAGCREGLRFIGVSVSLGITMSDFTLLKLIRKLRVSFFRISHLS